jgi:hypothetical protein
MFPAACGYKGGLILQFPDRSGLADDDQAVSAQQAFGRPDGGNLFPPSGCRPGSPVSLAELDIGQGAPGDLRPVRHLDFRDFERSASRPFPAFRAG